MRRFFITLLAVIAFTTAAQAQLLNKLSSVKFGLKAGVSMVSLNCSKVSTKIFDASASAGYHLGMQARVSLLGWFVQPELLYSSTKVDYILNSYSTRYNNNRRINTIDLPIMVGYKFGPVRLGGGVAFTLYDNKDGELFNTGRMPFAKESLTSYMLGAGVDLFSITLDARYVGNIKGANQRVYANGESRYSSVRRGAWQLSVGYMF